MAEIDTDALAEQLATNASQAQATQFDGLSVTERSATDQIENVRFLERRKVARRRCAMGTLMVANRPGTVN